MDLSIGGNGGGVIGAETDEVEVGNLASVFFFGNSSFGGAGEAGNAAAAKQIGEGISKGHLSHEVDGETGAGAGLSVENLCEVRFRQSLNLLQAGMGGYLRERQIVEFPESFQSGAALGLGPGGGGVVGEVEEHGLVGLRNI